MPLLLESIEEARLIRAMLRQQGKNAQDIVSLLNDMARICEISGRHSSAAALREVACEPWHTSLPQAPAGPPRTTERPS
jgi:hypothetical protein